MFFRLLFLSTLLGILYPVKSISQDVQFSLLTCDSGDQLYSTFGHSALRLQQKSMGVDMVFNYGMFDPRVEGFYLKFMRRELPYYLDAVDYKSFINEYTFDKRSVIEQKLELDSLQAATLVEKLQINFRKENRYYAYDFFYDNCSTRIEDILQKSTESTINYGEKFNQKASLRHLLDEHLLGKPWSDYGIDLVIGARADKIATIEEQMFLPSYLYKYYAQSSIGSENLVASEDLLLDYKSEGIKRNQFPLLYKPITCFILLLSIEFLLFIFYRKKNNTLIAIYDKTWFLGLFIISLVIIFLWFFTAHEATKANWNLIWISPIYFLVLMPKWDRSSFGKNIKLVLIGCTVLCILGWKVFPQQFHIAFLPMMAISIFKLLRSLLQSNRAKLYRPA